MFAALDWKSQEFYTYLAIAGAVLVALSIALWAVPGTRLKVPGIAVSIVGSLGLGVALGVIIMGMVGYQFTERVMPPSDPSQQPPGNPPGNPPGGMGMMGGGRGGMAPPGSGGGGGRGPNNKAQLALLVGKLDLLTEKPLTVQLTDEQRKQVREQLKGLADAEDLSDDEAKEKLEKLQDVLKDQNGPLEATGFRWLGQGGAGGGRGGPGGGQPPANPFKSEQNAEHLKRLTERLGKT